MFAIGPVMKRFYSEPVSGGKKPAFFLIPDRKREHSPEPFETVFCPMLISSQEYFRIRVTAERKTLFDEFLSQLDVIINLTVERDPKSPGCVTHRLMTGIGQIDNSEAAMSEGRALNFEEPFSVRSAMALKRDHLPHGGRWVG
jgi:hypothetical protein